jgi:hypothetical protein
VLTTRMTDRYREHLAELRRSLAKLPESPLRESIEFRLDLMGRDLAMGFPATEEVELEPGSPGDEVVLDSDLPPARESHIQGLRRSA